MGWWEDGVTYIARGHVTLTLEDLKAQASYTAVMSPVAIFRYVSTAQGGRAGVPGS